jgi:Domain of unknown function (DUF927)
MTQIQEPQKRKIIDPALTRVAWVNEPDDSACQPTEKWRLRFIKIEMSGRHEIEIEFLTRMGAKEILRIDSASRSDFDRIRRELDSRNARLPLDKKSALAFTETLMRQVPPSPFIACSSPGFRDGGTGFVMPKQVYGSARGKFIWDDNNASPEFGSRRGDLSAYSRGVLIPALSSPYLSAAILIPLASTLLGYTSQKTGKTVLTETAIFHFAGESSSGKTTLARVAQSVFGSPAIETDFEATDRGITEHAYQRNNLALIVDDTESAGLSDEEVWTRMQKLAQRVPSGRGKAIAGRAARADLPELKWMELTISTGPETFAELAKRLRHTRHGDQVRLLDVKLPPLEAGGIFGSKVTATERGVVDSAALIDGVEESISNSHGVLLGPWINYILAHDLAPRFLWLVQRFVHTTAGGENGLEQRFAKKFGVLYAAGVIGVGAGLLPWPKDWPMRAVGHCYINSRRTRDPESGLVNQALKRLAQELGSQLRFPQFRVARGNYPSWKNGQIGLRLVEKERTTTWLSKDRLALVCGEQPAMRDLVFAKLSEMKFLHPSAHSTSSWQFRVQTGSGEIRKPRLWKLNVSMLREWAGRASGTQRDGRTRKATETRAPGSSPSKSARRSTQGNGDQPRPRRR